MVETWAMFGATSVGLVVIIGLFVRIEHRMTKVETIVTILGKKAGICQQNLDTDIV
jgi:hypothetical protein